MLGDTLAGTHDLDRILDVIVQTACAATGATSGSILLVSDGLLRGPDVEVPIGDGLVGSVALTGVACRGRVERDGPALHPAEPGCHTYMAVPFRAPEAVRGVLALYDRHGDDEFDDEDLVIPRNYRTMTESLRREVERANRFGHRLCVLVLDLDRFKNVNDSYGHGAGDAVLVEFARRVRGVIREVDLAFRRGGEEFVVLLPETDAAGGVIVAQRLCSAIRGTPVEVPTRSIAVTVSVGIAVFPDHGASGPAVLEIADQALYAAKADGRDTFRLAASGDHAASTGGSASAVTGGASGGPQPATPPAGR